MPTTPTYPGGYVEDLPSNARTIEGVATSITAFVGRTVKGPLDEPTHVTSVSDFESHYGGLAADCPLTHAVRHYFANGGRDAVIARIVHRDADGTVNEGAPITDADIVDPEHEAARRGLWLLDQADLVNLLCIPPLAPGADVAPATWNAAIHYARRRRAFVIVDAPAGWASVTTAAAAIDTFIARDANAALYFPRILAPDPLNSNLLDAFAPCGAVAGLYARTDRERGVWKGPAGTSASLQGSAGLSVPINDGASGSLNPLAINALREFPVHGAVAWGARTLAGTDAARSEWQYVPVRRMALFIEESLDRGLAWVVFEANGESLWAAIRASVGDFLHRLFRQGAFQGTSPWQAYFVKCDATTTTAADMNNGTVNLLVGFAPFKPAEFVVLHLALRTTAPPGRPPSTSAGHPP